MAIFSFFGSILGYLLWALFCVFKNFGVSIIFFTIVVKVDIFPFSIKQQKSMAKTSRLQSKQMEIQKKYANNKQKMNEEMQKLYEKEGVSPGGGCLSSLIPFIIILGIFYAVAYPLTNTLHIDSEIVDGAVKGLSTYPGLSNISITGYYPQIKLISYISQYPQLLTEFFTNAADQTKLLSFIDGFSFCGLDLLSSPNGFATWSKDWFIYLTIPVLSFVSSVGAQVVTTKINGNAQAQQGCMKFMMYGMPLFTAYIAYVVPAAVGFYWICSSVFSLVQTIIMGKFYSAGAMIAKEEAQNIALLEQSEAQVKYAYAPVIPSTKKNKNKKKK